MGCHFVVEFEGLVEGCRLNELESIERDAGKSLGYVFLPILAALLIVGVFEELAEIGTCLLYTSLEQRPRLPE